MNIQLRDSKPLQAAIRKAYGRNAVPKPQLHPELLNGIVEASREGFDIRSEILIGHDAGQPNPIDLRHMADFLPAPAECTARWTISEIKQGDSAMRIPSELVFTFDDNSKIAIRTQAVPDVTKLTSALPSDQTAKFEASYQAGRITMVRAGGQREPARSGLSLADLQTLAPQLGVEWDKNASNETNIQRVQEAIAAKGEAGKGSEPVKARAKDKAVAP